MARLTSVAAAIAAGALLAGCGQDDPPHRPFAETGPFLKELGGAERALRAAGVELRRARGEAVDVLPRAEHARHYRTADGTRFQLLSFRSQQVALRAAAAVADGPRGRIAVDSGDGLMLVVERSGSDIAALRRGFDRFTRPS